MRLTTHVVCLAGLLCLPACKRPAEGGPGADQQPEDRAGSRPSAQGPNAAPEAPAPGEGAPGSARTPPSVAEANRQGDVQPKAADAKFTSVPGVPLNASANLEEVNDGVRIKVSVKAGPPGTKGIHVHQTGDCSDIAGKSMGEHFTPEHHQHGLPQAPEHHLGDLGNIDISPGGQGGLDITVPDANLRAGDPKSFVGKALVIHAGQDIGTGKSGESGQPIACAVIVPAA
jgi:superoxide dismutase, Cu-Zn family